VLPYYRCVSLVLSFLLFLASKNMFDSYIKNSTKRRKELSLVEVFCSIWDECISNALTGKERAIGATTLINMLQFMRGDLTEKNLQNLELCKELSELLFLRFINGVCLDDKKDVVKPSSSLGSLHEKPPKPLCPFLLSSCDFYLFRALFLVLHTNKYCILEFFEKLISLPKIVDFHPLRDIISISGEVKGFFFFFYLFNLFIIIRSGLSLGSGCFSWG
jgi:hypothetical protein